jgi:SAM-dependent methyltransferase
MNQVLENSNLTHQKLSDEPFEMIVERIRDKIRQRGDLPYIPAEKQLELLEALTQFDLGRFLIERGGLNGYWIDYAVMHPSRGRLTGLNNRGEPFEVIESFILDGAPIALATQQRFAIFKQEIQKRVQSHTTLAAIPCGLMADLLELDFTGIEDFKLIGVDIDEESIGHAKQIAQEKELLEHCQFLHADAWNLPLHQEVDLIASNGLTHYEQDDQRVIALYKCFWEALKPGGCLVTSFMTPPPIQGVDTEWILERVNPHNALLQKVIFNDILESKWQVFRSENSVKNQLHEAGFKNIEVLYDEAHIFPTVVAST